MKAHSIFLPPLEEQRRIAAILDEASAQLERGRKRLRLLEAAEISMFEDEFGEGDSSWPSITLGNVARVQGGKRLPKGEGYAFETSEHPYIRVTDLRRGRIEVDGLKYISEEVHSTISKYTVSEGDVVLSIAGSIGIAAPTPAELSGANLTENAAKIVLVNPHIDSTWLAASLNSPRLQRQIEGHTGRATIGKLALFRIEKLELQLPPYHRQLAYADRVRSLRSLSQVASESLRRSSSLIAAAVGTLLRNP